MIDELEKEAQIVAAAMPEHEGHEQQAHGTPGDENAEPPKPESEPAETVEPAEESISGAVAEEAAEEVVESAETEEGKPEKATRKKAKKAVQALKELDPVRAAFPWYAVHTYSGFEMRVKLSIEEWSKQYNLEHRFGNILVPQETVVELVRGQKKTSTRKFFPGYILVQMDMDDVTWHLVKDTPKVTGFVGDSRNPSPLKQEEVASLLSQLQGGGLKPKPKVTFEEGDAVKVIDGPFADFNGTVDEVKADKGKLRVLISIFGRNTPVELDFIQVEKI